MIMESQREDLNLSETSGAETVGHSKAGIWIRQLRAPFFTASVVPVLVGSSLGFLAAGGFEVGLFLMALVAMVGLHAGANIANDYFDHKSGNDWANRNHNMFSGGSRLIQEGLLSPRAVLTGAFVAFGIAAVFGMWIVLITRSLFVLVLGIIGLLGGYFYTAEPIKLGYRCVGEIVIGFLFGLLPVYGCYYLQTGRIDILPLAPAIIVSVLIFLIILINEFPDFEADAAVSKKTLVVLLGPAAAEWIYRIALVGSYVIAIVVMVFQPVMRIAAGLYLLTAPLSFAVIRSLKNETFKADGKLLPNRLTILIHLSGGLLITLGFVISGIFIVR